MKFNFLLLIVLVFSFLFQSCQRETTIIQTASGPEEISTEELLQTLGQAYSFGYPLVMMDLTKRVTTNIEKPHSERPIAPINQISHFRSFPDHTLTAIVKPNVDTYYSIAWLDLKDEPQVLLVPASDRYYLLPLYDAYTNVFASPGTRTTGTKAQKFIITGPDWNGAIPDSLSQIQAPTNMVWLLGRVQVNSPEDGATVVRDFQDGLQLIPLNGYKNVDFEYELGKVDPENSSIIPSKSIQDLDVNSFFNRMVQLMKDNPPAMRDSAMVAKMKKIGIVPGQEFTLSMDNFILKTKIKALPGFIHKKMEQRRAQPDPNFIENGWIVVKEDIGSYDVDYLRRSFISFIGLGANLPEDAIYPNGTLDINGDALDAAKKYQIHFHKDSLPPVRAFWSLTAYNEDEFLVNNSINRYALGDRDSLSFNDDGSLDLYIQHEQPAEDKHPNWLPVPKEGPFSLTMRLYWPGEEILNGSWKMPAVIPVQD